MNCESPRPYPKVRPLVFAFIPYELVVVAEIHLEASISNVCPNEEDVTAPQFTEPLVLTCRALPPVQVPVARKRLVVEAVVALKFVVVAEVVVERIELRKFIVELAVE